MSAAPKNLLYYGDNLDVLRQHVKDETVDLVYLDPPFKSNQDYNVLFGSHGVKAAAQIKAFEDTWRWDETASLALFETIQQGGPVGQALLAFGKLVPESDILAYLAMMAPRLVELRRVLKPTGSLYLHCDPTVSHYLKLLLDSIFGPTRFRNEIVWKRTFAHGGARRYGPVHDTLLFYSRGDAYVWNPQHVPYSLDYIEDFFRFKDSDGKRYRATILTGSGTRTGASGKPWRGIDPTATGRHWAIPGYVRDLLGDPPPKDTQDALDRLDAHGRVVWPAKKGGTPSFKQYLDDLPGVPLQDVWTDIPPISAQAKERLGYPTQKPEALLERIIRASSKEGDLVLDPFCGCGTAVAVAQRLGRRWVGIDLTHLAVNLIRHRLRDAHGDKIEDTYRVIGEPTTSDDAAELARTDPMQFQWWALGLVGARPATSEQKTGADKGVDGRVYFRDEPGKVKQIVLSVKAGQTGSAHVDQLRGVVDKEEAAIGALITFQHPTKPMRENAASAGHYVSPGWNQPYSRIQLLTVVDLLSGKARLQYPHATGETFKKAPKAAAEAPNAEPLPFE